MPTRLSNTLRFMCIHCICTVYTHVCVYMYVHTHICIAYIHTMYTFYLFICIHTCIHTYRHPCMHAYIHPCMHACMHKYIHPCMHTHMHANKGLVRGGCERERGGRPGQRSAADTEPPHPFGMASWRHAILVSMYEYPCMCRFGCMHTYSCIYMSCVCV